MAKIVVLGGCGQVGSYAVRTLASMDDISGVVIADIALDRAQALEAEIGPGKVTSLRVDALDPESVRAAIRGCDVVLNCTGPFYKFVPTILRTVIQEKIDYVDVCDDVDVTLEILGWDEEVRRAGITALIGMGSSPGVTNLMARYAADHLLDSVEAVDIFHAHGGEPVEGEGVIGHRLHCMSIDIPMFLDGELKNVSFFREDGVALRQKVDFHRLGEGILVYPYPHPEQVTIPRYIPARRVTNKGTVLPDRYFELIAGLCEAGLTSREPLDVKGCAVSPYDFAVAYILRERERILEETRFGPQRGCLKVVVEGKKAGKPHRFVFSIASESQALGEGTGIPAALGALLMARGKVSGKGIMPPEGCVNPVEFLDLVGTVMKPAGGGSGKSFEGVLVESIDHEGRVEKMQL